MIGHIIVELENQYFNTCIRVNADINPDGARPGLRNIGF
jgi:hypothetical protein